MAQPIYIASTGMVAATGYTAAMVASFYNANYSAYKSVDYFTENHHRIVMATVPSELLDNVIFDDDRLSLEGRLSFRNERLLKMSLLAAKNAMESHKDNTPVGVILAGPEAYENIENQLPREFTQLFHFEAPFATDPINSRTVSTGRTGVLEALKIAYHYLQNPECKYLLIGGVDTYQHSELLAALDRDGRVKSDSPGASDAFVPGEAAAFLLLTNNPAAALHNQLYRYRLTLPGFGMEPGHLYSDKPYQGAGLDQSFKQALKELPPNLVIRNVYSSMNGENFWAKELGVAVTRSQQYFQNFKHHHPAESYGDVGAASAGCLLGIALHNALRSSNPETSLIYAASDHAYRAAVCLLPERMTS